MQTEIAIAVSEAISRRRSAGDESGHRRVDCKGDMMLEQEVIVEPAELEQDVDATLAAYREAKAETEQAEKQASTWREALARRRYELGRALTRMRSTWPPSGPKAKGWSDFLEQKDINHDVALDAMAYYSRTCGGSTGTGDGVPEDLPTLRDVGIDKRARATDEYDDGAGRQATTDTSDADPLELDEPEIDRDTWCTPVWITDGIGEVDLDPCANQRSHVNARSTFRLDRGQNGLALAQTIGHDWRVFINPPYSNVQPWIAAYKHTRFCFLLKLDPSTKWFAELFEATALILIPRGTRIEFEAPPGVPKNKAGANQFPHALFLARAEDAPAEIINRCFTWRTR